MSTDALRAKRAELKLLLERCESGRTTHQDEDILGELARDTTKERIACIQAHIAEINRMLSNGVPDA